MPSKHEFKGIVQAVLIAPSADTLESIHCEEVRVNFSGFEGDKHSGLTRKSDGRTLHYPRGIEIRNSRQVSIVSTEDLEGIAESLGIAELVPEWLGANLMVSGIPNLSLLPPSTRLVFPSQTVLIVSEENLPCIGPGKLIQANYPGRTDLAAAFPKAAMHRRGLVAWVERPGIIHQRDEIVAEIVKRLPYLL